MRNADARTRAAAGDASVFNAGRHHHAFLLMPRFIAPMVVAATMVVGADVASGQNYPVKPIRLLTAEPGGGLDVAARIIAQGLTGSVGKQVIVENHGAGAFAAEIVAKAINSLTDFTGNEGCTTTRFGDLTASVIGEKSLTGSHGTSSRKNGAIHTLLPYKSRL